MRIGKKLSDFLRRPAGRYSMFVFLAGAGLAGIIFSAGFATFIERTNTMEFCTTSCHEMVTFYEEYKETRHYNNRSGVRADCSDCHIPKGSWTQVVIKKAYAGTKDIFAHLIGTIDTPEKLEAKRLELATRVWESMMASDSAECRNCHAMAAMALPLQQPRAKGQHEEAMMEGKTCIECHKGIYHKPVHEEVEEKEEIEFVPPEF